MTSGVLSIYEAIVVFASILACFSSQAHAQSESGIIYGSVSDATGAVVANATLRLVDIDRGTQGQVATGDTGFYAFATVRPGRYRIEVEKSGFKLARLTEIIVNVLENLQQNFILDVGPVSESVTVEANSINVNTTDATASTLIDHRFIENLPLNGRSFGSLVDLTPGVVLSPATGQEQGQFSVNGQRPDANYFTVDGVSANLGTSAVNLSQGGAGQLPATSAFGGMSNLVSLDALQEFRIQTSTFAPEFGRSPGAQVSVVTKSGTNALHGIAFEYLRNDVLDANNWFANNKGLPKPALRQNDFGGVLGGPIKKDKLFFFGSYEGLRVRQPLVANTYVPTLATIQNAPAAVQPLLNAFPKPNGPDLGNGTAAFSAGYSDPSSLDSFGGRIDYLLSRKITLFGRYSNAPSNLQQRDASTQTDNYSTVLHTKYRMQSVTVGSDQSLTDRLINEVRFNYSHSRAHSFLTLDDFDGAVPPPNGMLFPSFASPENAAVGFFGDLNPFGLKFLIGELGNNLQRQINITDNVSHLIGTHQLKFGLDYRRISPEEDTVPYQLNYVFGSVQKILDNQLTDAFIISRTPATLVFPNWSLYGQDTWKLTHNLTMTYGLRWEYDAAPFSPNGTLPFTVNQVNNFSTMTLAPAGSPLWQAQKDDFAPRLGAAWQVFPTLVIRTGAGIFYDLGYSQVANAASAFPYGRQKVIVDGSFPLSAANASPVPFQTSPPVPFLAVVDPNHVLPRTYEWNAAVERSMSEADAVTLTYVGAGGRKLMRHDIYVAPNPNFTGEFDVLNNAGTSSYNALQAQYRRNLSRGLQTLVSYTWAHSIDNVSSDGNFQNVPLGKSRASHERGPSDYDIRNTFSGAVSYDFPSFSGGLWKQVFGSWSTDSIVYTRSAPPLNVVTGNNPFGGFLSGANSVQRPNVVHGVPFYLHPSGTPGSKIINSAAFTTPVPSTEQGDLGRNALRGFGATQWDLTLRHQFRFTERVLLQFRGDFFNILNHPNFGNPINYLSSPQFGHATQMLNNYLGSGGQSGGLNPLYQIGGPRSTQLALKLQF
jgi:Carboxypeptidase regulatory-like domain/TonB dependent receptor